MWKIADAADYLDAKRLKFCALKFLKDTLSRDLYSPSGIQDARKLMGFPASMKGLYRTVGVIRDTVVPDVVVLAECFRNDANVGRGTVKGAQLRTVPLHFVL